MEETARIPIPPIATERCHLVRACAELTTEDPEILPHFATLAEREARVAKIGAGADECYAILFGGPSGKGNHLHLDVGRAVYFSEPPVPTNEVSELERLIGLFRGRTFNVQITGRYMVAMNDVPETGFLKRVMYKAAIAEGDTVIEQTGASFRFHGSPISYIYWFKKPDDTARVEVRIETALEVRDDYLQQVYVVVDTVFSGLVLSGFPRRNDAGAATTAADSR